MFMVHDAMVVEHDGSAPVSDAVAVSARHSVSEALTVIFDVPWPLMIFPAVNDHVIAVAVFCLSPVTFATNVIGLSASGSLGQLTVITGQIAGGFSHSEHCETVTEVAAAAACCCPSFTSTVAV
jgi:hypothetical protein